MNETVTEPEPRTVDHGQARARMAADVEREARQVMAVLKEYAGKLVELNKQLGEVIGVGKADRWGVPASEVAWVLDQSELIRKPLLVLLSRGSGLREHAPLESITRDELSLRMTETEVHLHHMMRRTGELRDFIEGRKSADDVARLRYAAGLPTKLTRS